MRYTTHILYLYKRYVDYILFAEYSEKSQLFHTFSQNIIFFNWLLSKILFDGCLTGARIVLLPCMDGGVKSKQYLSLTTVVEKTP